MAKKIIYQKKNSYLIIKKIKLNKCMNIEHQFSFCEFSVRSVSLKFPKILHQLELQLTKSLAIAFILIQVICQIIIDV